MKTVVRKSLITIVLLLVVPLVVGGTYLNNVRIQQNAVAEVLALGGAVHYSDGLLLGGPEHPTLADKPDYHDFRHVVWGVSIQKSVPPPKDTRTLSAADLQYVRQLRQLDVVQFNNVAIPREDFSDLCKDLPQTAVEKHDVVVTP